MNEVSSRRDSLIATYEGERTALEGGACMTGESDATVPPC